MGEGAAGRGDGYAAVQLGFKDKKRKNATRPEQGHVAAGLKSKRKEARQKAGVALPPKADVEPQKVIREFRLDVGGAFVQTSTVNAGPAEASFKVERIRVSGEGATKKYEAYAEDMTLKVGDKLTIDQVFKDVLAVDVIGTTKGRGYAGVMKRHNFQGMPAAHGAKKVHRQAGSTSSLASNRGGGRPNRQHDTEKSRKTKTDQSLEHCGLPTMCNQKTVTRQNTLLVVKEEFPSDLDPACAVIGDDIGGCISLG